MLMEFRDPNPFIEGWQPPANYDPAKSFYDQPAFLDYRRFTGSNFESGDYSFWQDTGRLRAVQEQLGDIRPLFQALKVGAMLSLGSARPFWEVLIAQQVPDVKIIATDINFPSNIVADLAKATEFGFAPVADRIRYETLDIRDKATFTRLVTEGNVDTLFVCAAFSVVPNQVWQEFLPLARSLGVKNVILFHAEELSPLSILRAVLFRRRMKGVLIGSLRSKGEVVRLFSEAGYTLLGSHVPPRAGGLLKRLLTKLQIHYARRAYVFSTNQHPLPTATLKAALTS